MRALLSINGGGAAALLLFLQAIWKTDKALASTTIWALMWLSLGAALAAGFHLLRYRASVHYQRGDRARGEQFGRFISHQQRMAHWTPSDGHEPRVNHRGDPHRPKTVSTPTPRPHVANIDFPAFYAPAFGNDDSQSQAFYESLTHTPAMPSASLSIGLKERQEAPQDERS